MPKTIEDHPHACGDKRNSLLRHRSNPGSSPRVWGQVNSGTGFHLYYRIIPTRVGTSLPAIANDFKTAYHPHACGDKSSVPRSTVPNTGSSPRMWGQVDTIFSGLANCRIIPTRVGTSPCSSRIRKPPGDHPHACGDKFMRTGVF